MPCQVALASWHALLLVDMIYNFTRISTEVCIYAVSLLRAKKENSFHKLIHIVETFMRKVFMVQHYPRNILTSNYTRTAICMCIYVHTKTTHNRAANKYFSLHNINIYSTYVSM